VVDYIDEVKTDAKKLEKLIEEHIVFLSKNDPAIPYEAAKKYYEKSFENAKIISFENRGHFSKKR